jgi:alpha-L-fucosidase
LRTRNDTPGQEGRGYRPLAEMVGIYHDSVGKGGNMLLNVAPPMNSTLPRAAIQTYQALGEWVSQKG